jgi:hypothetical protein
MALMPNGRRGRLVVAALTAFALVGLDARPAWADPPEPTDVRSEVVRITPGGHAIDARVAGGDSFLVLEVDRGHEAEVPGYSGEPYLRFRRDGTVEENAASAAAYLNQARNGSIGEREFDPGTPPRWRTVATDGRWAWHDHRIHLMGGTVPDDARSAAGHPWTVPLLVDGREVEIRGRYRLVSPPSPVPWLVLALAVAGATAVATARVRDPVGAAGVALLVAGGCGVVAGAAQRGASPPGAPASTLLVVLPALALIAGVIAVMQRGRVLRATVALAGAACAVGWAVVRLPVFWKAVLPTDLGAPLDRALTVIALGAAAGAAIALVRSAALTPPIPAEDEREERQNAR